MPSRTGPRTTVQRQRRRTKEMGLPSYKVRRAVAERLELDSPKATNNGKTGNRTAVASTSSALSKVPPTMLGGTLCRLAVETCNRLQAGPKIIMANATFALEAVSALLRPSAPAPEAAPPLQMPGTRCCARSGTTLILLTLSLTTQGRTIHGVAK